jgi:hypothetical protein
LTHPNGRVSRKRIAKRERARPGRVDGEVRPHPRGATLGQRHNQNRSELVDDDQCSVMGLTCAFSDSQRRPLTRWAPFHGGRRSPQDCPITLDHRQPLQLELAQVIPDVAIEVAATRPPSPQTVRNVLDSSRSQSTTTNERNDAFAQVRAVHREQSPTANTVQKPSC